MNFEYQMLAVMGIFSLFAYVPSSVAKYQTFGKKWLASNRKPIEGKELVEWGARVQRAHENLKDNIPGFIIAVLALGQMNKFDDTSWWLCLVYVIARMAHFTFYGMGIVGGRALSYLIGLVCNVWLLFMVFV